MNKTIRRVVALATGAAMLGATIMGAAAADLSTYPAPFLTSGKFDATIVYGKDAKVEDVIGGAKLASWFQSKAVTQSTVNVPGVAPQTSVSDGYKLEAAGQRLYTYYNISSVRESLTSNELPSLLADGTITDDDGADYDYKQFIRLPKSAIMYGKDTPNTDAPVFYADFNNGETYQLEINFDTAINLTMATDASINLFGKQYTFSGNSAELSPTRLVLYGGGTDKTITAGEVATINIDGVDTEVRVSGVNTDANPASATVTIGSETRQVKEGDNKVIGGHRVYIKDIFAYTVPTANGAVRMFLGTDKLELRDGETIRKGTSGTDIGGSNVQFSPNTGKTSKITITVEPQDMENDVEFLAVGKEFVDPVFGGFKMMYGGVSVPETDSSRELITLAPNGDKNLKLAYTNANGNKFAMNIFEGSESEAGASDGLDPFYLRNDGDNIHVKNGEVITEDEYFIVGQNKYQHFLRLIKVYDGADSDYIRVKDMASGETKEWSFISNAGDMTYDGYAYPFTVGTRNITVTSGSAAYLHTQGGAKIMLPDVAAGTALNGTSANVTLQEETTYNSDNADSYGFIKLPLWYEFGDGNEDFRVSTPTYISEQADPSLNVVTPAMIAEDNSDNSHMFTPYGTYVMWNDESYQAEVHYLDYQTFHNLFVAPLTAEVVGAGSTGGSVTTSVVQVINVEAANKLDTQVADAKAMNVISVGGPCINKVSAELLGLTYPACGAASSVPENSAMLKLVENGGKVGLIVAGWEAANTNMAVAVLTNPTAYSTYLKGKEVVVKGTSVSDIVVSAPQTQ